MRIGILTYQYVDNYGAVLQAFALKEYLETIGHQVSIINYDNKKLRTRGKKTLSIIKSNIWKCLKVALAGGSKHKVFNDFRKNSLSLSKVILYDWDALQAEVRNRGYECIITGSDQVWNPSITNYDKAYILDFDFDNVRKIAYAASFGKSSIENVWMKHVVDSIDSSYYAVSVRENTAKHLLENNGCKTNIFVVPDPVFLLDRKQWLRLSENCKINCNTDKYILCYVMPGDKSMETLIEENAKKLSSILSLPIRYIGRKEFKRFKKDGFNYFYASPSEFIALFSNASYILTNSFHGTAFSIIFKKQFYSFVNSKLNSEEQLGSRLVDLLSECGLSERCVSKVLDKYTNIVYEDVEPNIKAYIEKGKIYIDKIS